MNKIKKEFGEGAQLTFFKVGLFLIIPVALFAYTQVKSYSFNSYPIATLYLFFALLFFATFFCGGFLFYFLILTKLTWHEKKVLAEYAKNVGIALLAAGIVILVSAQPPHIMPRLDGGTDHFIIKEYRFELFSGWIILLCGLLLLLHDKGLREEAEDIEFKLTKAKKK